MKRYISKVLSVCIILCTILGACGSTKEDIEAIVETTIDSSVWLREEKEKKYYTDNIYDKAANIRLASEYEADTLIDDMDTILMGRYLQDDDMHKDYIEWIALDREDDKILLLSKYILDNKMYSINDANTTWDTSYLRRWLNDDFYVNAFTIEEKENIFVPILRCDDNKRWGISAGTDTMDKIFILSASEVDKYFHQEDMCSENKRLATYPTRYAKEVDNYGYKLWTNDDIDTWFRGYASFYLRTPGVSPTDTSVVNHYGYLNTFGVKVRSYNIGVRPAMWVKYK